MQLFFVQKILRSPLLLTAFLCLVVAVLYANTLRNAYTLDDNFVVNEKTAKGFAAIPSILTTKYVVRNQVGQAYGYRPVVLMSYAVEAALFGQNAAVSHAINMLLYAITAMLLYYLLVYFWGYEGRYGAMLATLLFVCLPIHTEVVASAKSRDELLAFLCCLLSWHSYRRFVSSQQWWWIVVGMLFFWAACLSKPTIIPLTLLIPCSFYWLGKTQVRPTLVMGASLLLVFVSMYAINNAIDSADNIGGRVFLFFENPLFYDKSWLNRTATASYCLAKYGQLLLLPHPLLYYYGYNQIPIVGWSNPIALLSLVVHIGLVAAMLYYRQRQPVASFALFYYLCNVAMFANVVKPGPGIIAERFIYIASWGFCMLCAYGAVWWWQHRPQQRTWVVGATAVVLLAWSVRTMVRCNDWRTNMQLFAHDMPYLQQSFKANLLYGSALLAAPSTANLLLAEQHYQKALLLYDQYYIVWNNLGYVLLLQKRPNDALTVLQKAYQLAPNAAEVTYNIAQAAEQIQDTPQAIQFYKKTIQLSQQQAQAEQSYLKLHQIYTAANNVAEATQNLQQAIQAFGTNLYFYDELARLQYPQQPQQAIATWEKALTVNPNNQTLIYKLARAYESIANLSKAQYYDNKLKK